MHSISRPNIRNASLSRLVAARPARRAVGRRGGRHVHQGPAALPARQRLLQHEDPPARRPHLRRRRHLRYRRARRQGTFTYLPSVRVLSLEDTYVRSVHMLTLHFFRLFKCTYVLYVYILSYEYISSYEYTSSGLAQETSGVSAENFRQKLSQAMVPLFPQDIDRTLDSLTFEYTYWPDIRNTSWRLQMLRDVRNLQYILGLAKTITSL